MNKQKMIVIVGPTASGKTSLGIEIAKQFNGEVISADSRAIYREMNIGTAKPGNQNPDYRTQTTDKYLVDGIVHHGFDLVDPDEHFHAFDFKQFAESKINDIVSRGKVPIVVGGTGLYISGLVDNFDFEGGTVGESKFYALQIGLKVERQTLYGRIDQRVDAMIEQGLVDEVQSLKEKYGCRVKSITGIGYRQICEYLDGKVDLDKAVENLKRNSRHYAKRQMTWFKRDKRIHWIDNSQDAIKLVEDFLAT